MFSPSFPCAFMIPPFVLIWKMRLAERRSWNVRSREVVFQGKGLQHLFHWIVWEGIKLLCLAVYVMCERLRFESLTSITWKTMTCLMPLLSFHCHYLSMLRTTFILLVRVRRTNHSFERVSKSQLNLTRKRRGICLKLRAKDYQWEYRSWEINGGANDAEQWETMRGGWLTTKGRIEKRGKVRKMDGDQMNVHSYTHSVSDVRGKDRKCVL